MTALTVARDVAAPGSDGTVSAVEGWVWPVPDGSVEVDPVSGVAVSADEWLAASAVDEFVRSASPFELREWYRMVSGDVLEVDFDDAWARTSRVAPRPLPGVTGVCGADLAAAMAKVEPSVLSPGQLVELMCGAERLSRWAQGVQLAAVRAFAEFAVVRDPDTVDFPLADVPGGVRSVEVGFGTQREIDEFCGDGIGAALGVSYTAAGQLVAASYAAEMPVVQVMLAAGQLDLARVKVIARRLAGVPNTGEDAGWVDRVVAEHHLLTPRRLDRVLRRLVMERSPDGDTLAHVEEVSHRRVWVSPQDAGMAIFSQYLTADEAMAAYQAVNAEAWSLHDAAIRTGQQPACQRRPGYNAFDTFRADAFMSSMNALHTHHLTRTQQTVPELDPTGPFEPGGVSDSNATSLPTISGSDDGGGESSGGGSGRSENSGSRSGNSENGVGGGGNSTASVGAEGFSGKPDGEDGGSGNGGETILGGPDGASVAVRLARRGAARAAATSETSNQGVHTTGPVGSEIRVSTGRGEVVFVAPDPNPQPWVDHRHRQDQAADGRTTRPGRRLDPARVMLHVYMAASTVAGLDNQPADLLGYGPIPADQARQLVQNARVTRILTDPFSGDIRSVETPSYRVPKLMRWAMQARDRTCTFPSCDVPAYDVQADHLTPHPFGRRVGKALATGTTTLSNLWSLCTHHHRLKTHAGWSIQTTRGARLEWISPTGHSYLRNADWGPPPSLWPDHPPAPNPATDDEPCPF